MSNTLNEEIIQWSKDNWPKRNHESVEKKLVEELGELLQAFANKDALNTIEEIFDVYAMIVDWCNLNCVDLNKIFKAKREIIEFRKTWGKMPNQERAILRSYI